MMGVNRTFLSKSLKIASFNNSNMVIAVLDESLISPNQVCTTSTAMLILIVSILSFILGFSVAQLITRPIGADWFFIFFSNPEYFKAVH